MSRWKAASIHLSISLAVALLVGSLIYFVWYSPPYFRLAGGSTLMLLIIGVHIVLGPLLTLTVFKSGKRGLKFDLTVIALLQLTALCYGIGVIALARPVFVVAVVDRFAVVAANQLDDEDLAQATTPQFATRSWNGPRLVGTEAPEGGYPVEIVMSAINGKDVEKYPRFYVGYDRVAAAMLTQARPLQALIDRQPAAADLIRSRVAALGLAVQDLAFVPLVGRGLTYVMVLSTRTGQPLAVVAIDPWLN